MPFSPARPPLRFVAPPTWPAPPEEWVVRNQGWQPPTGWLPPIAQPDPQQPVQPAPQGWLFWQPNGAAWDEYRQPFAKHAHRAILVGGIMLGIGIAITLAGILGEFGRSYYLLYGTLIFGVVRIVTGLMALRKVDPAARARITADTLEVRRQLDSESYRGYLDATARERAQTGAPAMTFDEFGFARDAVAWGGPGVPAPLAPGMPGGAQVAPGRRSRRGLAVGLGAAAAVVIGIAVPLAVPHGSASSAVSNLSGGSTATSVESYIPDDAWDVVDSGNCSVQAGCWQLEVTPAKDCPAATIDWGFSDSKTGADKATRTSTAVFVAGESVHITIPVGDDMQGLDYIFLDDVRC